MRPGIGTSSLSWTGAMQGVSNKYLLLESGEAGEEEMSMGRSSSDSDRRLEGANYLDPHKLPASSEQPEQCEQQRLTSSSGSHCLPPFPLRLLLLLLGAPQQAASSVSSRLWLYLGRLPVQIPSPMHSRNLLGSGQSGDFPPLSPSGLGTIPSSRVPSWKDWAKPGPYDQPMVNTLKRSKERRETTDPSSHQSADVTTPGEEPQGVKGGHSVTSPKEDREAHEELARALARGLQLDIHGSSRDSLQGSSGYSSQTNTPCCSEDTIPSQVSDCDYYTVGVDQEGEQQQSSDFDKSSTIPRNSDISQSYRRMFQSKRPASTAGLPSNPSAVITPGVATIRRTPSSKPNLRRPSGGLNLGPIPIKPPMIPVKTPTVPEHPGFPSRATSEDGNTPRTPLSPLTTPLSPGSNGPLSPKTSPCNTQHPCKGSDPPTPPPQPGGRVSEWERRPLPELLEETEYGEVEDYLVAIRRGVKLKKTMTNDRSAPSIH
ncbi:protein MTSS 1-like protein [Lates japonicus]|uniref:Protein MTSS 1-like protein n=1 Tax=Lates japonicus TaxID=270547 RepID=A0AAD3MT38_LATJO|nr:protein MTSS 1-like protein [Lates japonicus]